MTLYLHHHQSDSLEEILFAAAGKLTRRKQRRHELFVLTCYVDFGAIEKLVTRLVSVIKLRKVKLVFEYMEIFRSRRPNETLEALHALSHNMPQIEFEWHAIRSGALMHAKGYCISQFDAGRLIDGAIITSSGNATMPGLGGAGKRNIELSNISTSAINLKKFNNICESLSGKFSVNIDEKAAEEDAYAVRYALLSSGVFLHKWSLPYSSQVGLRYRLTQKGKDDISQLRAEFKGQIDLDQETVSRQPLRMYGGLKDLITKALPRQFSRAYTIDTLLGRWCPKDVWHLIERLLRESDFYIDFLNDFKKATTPRKLDKICLQEKNLRNC